MSSLSAIVTGASSGIGRATALALAKAKYDLFLVARRKDRLEELAKEIKKEFPKVECHISEVDVQNALEVNAFYQTHKPDLENLEILVNNAGLAKGVEKVQDANPNDWDLMIDTNVRRLLYFTRGALPFLVKRKRGHIVNLGSVAAHRVYTGGAVYCATKSAVKALTEGFRMDLSGHNIRVTNIEPGMVETEFSVVRLGDQKRADLVYRNMKPPTSQDIADSIMWCLQRPAHVNIQELVIYPTDRATVDMVHRKA